MDQEFASTREHESVVLSETLKSQEMKSHICVSVQIKKMKTAVIFFF